MWAAQLAILFIVWLAGQGGVVPGSQGDLSGKIRPVLKRETGCGLLGGEVWEQKACQPEGEATQRGQLSRACCKVLWREAATGGAGQESTL